jgi:hypothetical protein
MAKVVDGKDVIAKISKCYKKERGNRVVLMLLTNTLFLWDIVARGSLVMPIYFTFLLGTSVNIVFGQ